MKKIALVAGPHGIVGNALVRHLDQCDNWDVVTVSRRNEAAGTRSEHIAVDLLDAAAVSNALARFPAITHIFYCAYAPRPTPMEEVEPNLTMLVNVVTAAEQHAKKLSRVVLVHGTKWYGNHLGPFPTPAREEDARHLPPNFYYDQQDWVAQRQKNATWSWTAFRPHGIYGYAKNSPMNHLMALSLYATVSRAAGNPLKFPGDPGAFGALNQYTDAGLLARAMVWSVDVEACKNEAFNINNGEPERWCNIWPNIAKIFGMRPGCVQQVRLADFMPACEYVWQEICQKHGLMPISLSDYVNWTFADWVYSNSFDQISSLHKVRRAGWTEVMSFEEMLTGHLSVLRNEKILPPV